MHGRTFCTEEFARDIELFAPDHDDLLTIEKLFGYCAGQAAEKVSLSIDGDLYRSYVSITPSC